MARILVCIAMLMLLALAPLSYASLHQSREASAEPAVLVAVAPNYFPSALNALASGEVVVEVTIDSKGEVTSVAPVSGNKILVAGSMNVARRWRFSETQDNTNARKVRLTFNYRLVPRGAAAADLVTIFKPPYRVEISREEPDSRPLP